MLKVIVERSKWLRGEGSPESYLLRPADGKMCCMGFACIAAGATPEQIALKKTVGDVDRVHPIFPIFRTLGTVESNLYTTNDFITILESEWDKEREARIIEHGFQAGLEFEFVD